MIRKAVPFSAIVRGGCCYTSKSPVRIYPNTPLWQEWSCWQISRNFQSGWTQSGQRNFLHRYILHTRRTWYIERTTGKPKFVRRMMQLVALTEESN